MYKEHAHVQTKPGGLQNIYLDWENQYSKGGVNVKSSMSGETTERFIQKRPLTYTSRSMKSELLVKSQVVKGDSSATSHKVQARRDLVSSKSVNELSQVRSLADVPIPSPILNLMEKRNIQTMGDDDTSSQCTG